MGKRRYGNELHPLYSRWLSMTQRCKNPNHKQYSDWEGRGITVDEELQNFSRYVAVIESLPGYSEKGTVDRIDNNKGYTPSNLRWVSHSTQIANQRPNSRGRNKYSGVNWSKTHNRWIARISYKGRVLLSKVCLTEDEALDVRNKFILENDLPHPIQQRQ